MKKIFTASLICIIVISILAAGTVTASTIPEKKVKAIIVFNDVPSDDDINYLKGNGGSIKYKYGIINGIALELPQQAYDNIVSTGKNSKKPSSNPIFDKISYIEIDQEVYATGKPSKVRPTPTPVPQSLPWGINRIGSTVAWTASTGAGVKVAVIDTGIDYDHPDLSGNVQGGYSCVSYTGDYKDDNGHGTHVAGIVAARNNDIGVVGVAPDAWLYGVKALNKKGSGYTSDVIEGIDWSVANGMQVITMSLGSAYEVQALHDAVDNAYANGIVVIAAAGNDYGGPINYPAAYDTVIAVTATDQYDAAASFSNAGPEAELAAPGVSIYSTYKSGTYAIMSGTSMSTPHVAGAAALLIADGITSPEDVRIALRSTAEDLGLSGPDPYYGYGLVNADAAVANAG
ncbi:S8 family peptidase [Methanooceanicella nereidis]|nr:S8 family peptidase [Methanocella sp. CWC-04]